MQLNRTVIAYNEGSLRRARGGEVVDEKQDNNTKLRLRGILDAPFGLRQDWAWR